MKTMLLLWRRRTSVALCSLVLAKLSHHDDQVDTVLAKLSLLPLLLPVLMIRQE